MGIKTSVERHEHSIHSQNRVVTNYAEQLKSKVISNGHRQALLKEMQLELTAEQYRQPLRRFYNHNTVRSYDDDVEFGDNFSPFNQPLFNPVQTGGQADLSVRKKVDNNYIKSKRSNGYIRTAQLRFTGEAKKVIDEAKEAETRYNDLVKAQRLKMISTSENKKKERRKNEVKRYAESERKAVELKNQKFTTAKMDSDDSVAIEAVQTVTAGVASAAQMGGYIRTAVGGTGKAAGKIATAVKTRHIFTQKSSIKDFGHIATAVSSGVANIAKDTGQQLIRTKIDKSTVTDTGTEAIKQGLTEIRYVDNARKAVLNTARTTVKAGRAIKNMPKNTKKRVKKIKKTAKRTKNAIVAVAKVIGKIITSPIGLIILLVLAVIALLVFLIILIVTVVSALISSLFGWLGDSGGTQRNVEEVVSGYTASIDARIDEIKADIHHIVDEFVCDRRQFPPYEEITELNQFGNRVLNDIDSNEVIAILATLRYRDVNSDVGISEMMFTDAEIAEVIERYYDFNYYYTYGHCSGCKEGHTEDGGTYIYCDVDHQWLHGEVVNYTLDEVLASYGFTADELNMFEIFYGQVGTLGGG
ncbi:MAG: hypothetical protein IK093_14090 [Ruminiclostridium sp.]|nr:hypothetical protein [Ruminiclostridium sp.]